MFEDMVMERFNAFVSVHPLFRMEDALRWGLRRHWVEIAARLGAVRSAAPGLFADSDYWPDPRETAAAYFADYPVCLESALYIHGLLDEEPEHVWFALGHGARLPRLQMHFPATFVVMSGASLTQGRTTAALHGWPVCVYTLEKTLADCLKFRKRLGEQRAHALCRRALADGRVNHDAFEEMVRICRVRQQAAPYLAPSISGAP